MQADIVDDGIERALKECGVDCTNGAVTARGHSRGKDHGMFLGDTDVEVALRVSRPEEIEAGAVGHGSGDGDDAGVFCGQIAQGVGKNFSVRR